MSGPFDQDTPRRAQLDRVLAAARHGSQVMGILNVTPDSFSDGGRYAGPGAALDQARAMVAAGAAIIDVGGESTRPGFVPVSADEELARVEPVLRALAHAVTVPISIDTTKPGVARRAVELGAVMVNDIWGFQGDPGMAVAVAETGTAAVLMHNRKEHDGTIDIVDDMRRFFDRSLALAERAGVPRRLLLLDPGIGFGKTPPQQLAALAGIGRLGDYGLPILVGVSRKSFLGRLTGAGPEGRLIETIAANLAAARRGARVFRVHDVAEHVAALTVFDAIGDAAHG